MNAKHPAKHVKSHESRETYPFFSLKFVKTDTQFDRRRHKKILKYYFFVHVLITHAKQFSKVDSPVISAISLATWVNSINATA